MSCSFYYRLPSASPLPLMSTFLDRCLALQLERGPVRIAIVGGGYIALEFAGIFHAFGAEVHVVFRQPKPLRGFDEEVRGFVMEQMAMQGIHFHPSESPTAVEEVEGQTGGIYWFDTYSPRPFLLLVVRVAVADVAPPRGSRSHTLPLFPPPLSLIPT